MPRRKRFTATLRGLSDAPVTRAGLGWVASRAAELFSSPDRQRCAVVIFAKACESRLILKDRLQEIIEESGLTYPSGIFEVASRLVEAGILVQCSPGDFTDMSPDPGKPAAIYLPDRLGLRRAAEGADMAYLKAKSCPDFAFYRPGGTRG